ncbi:MAG: hypothetical protein B7Y59_05520 [Burkholderiales bacterium 35-55-47]|jgi:hypothetical protein|uniref:YgaP family membrane protein n=1 Tax=Limnohabitans sp. TaxID=1907725 RepID=UPI000BCF0332|nr:DUF2892 domain-containing protein [Limnohabitans sp.]OYY19161.1 MAG: hypothetical protein B7Y59_05520 [Burkholderiales bacterium 35-55-47]OYZ73169.1 MAG: hypothetical protein B7Y06_07640 [Burkholderiales bacterium 24-55-52]OZB00313.1 MAG: hypothetical protein B7X62_07915 [Burkholderiales bacterium 39-55-53]HQR87473.1 DUF2892 domain-containing protein [Limnohabitans sp.]HQS26735.1 DUF2892 domain-containing protein [Limnohabitans sp.]
MTANVGGIDRILRIVAGLVLIALAATDVVGMWGYIVGGIVLATGVIRFCGAYTLLGINTCPLKATEEEPAK